MKSENYEATSKECYECYINITYIICINTPKHQISTVQLARVVRCVSSPGTAFKYSLYFILVRYWLYEL